MDHCGLYTINSTCSMLAAQCMGSTVESSYMMGLRLIDNMEWHAHTKQKIAEKLPEVDPALPRIPIRMTLYLDILLWQVEFWEENGSCQPVTGALVPLPAAPFAHKAHTHRCNNTPLKFTEILPPPWTPSVNGAVKCGAGDFEKHILNLSWLQT